FTDLGTLGGADSFAYGIGVFGPVVGSAQTATGHYHAFRLAPSATPPVTDLGVEVGEDSAASATNERGDIVGATGVTGRASHAFFLPQGATVALRLPTLGGKSSAAHALNNNVAPQIVGWATTAFGSKRAVLWQNGNAQALPLLRRGSTSEAFAIN